MPSTPESKNQPQVPAVDQAAPVEIRLGIQTAPVGEEKAKIGAIHSAVTVQVTLHRRFACDHLRFHARLIPADNATKGILEADRAATGRVVTAWNRSRLAARTARPAARDTAIRTADRRRNRDTGIVPGHFAAVRIELADARLQNWIRASRRPNDTGIVSQIEFDPQIIDSRGVSNRRSGAEPKPELRQTDEGGQINRMNLTLRIASKGHSKNLDRVQIQPTSFDHGPGDPEPRGTLEGEGGRGTSAEVDASSFRRRPWKSTAETEGRVAAAGAPARGGQVRAVTEAGVKQLRQRTADPTRNVKVAKVGFQSKGTRFGTRPTSPGGDRRDAEFIPLGFAAKWILVADTRLNDRVIAARSARLAASMRRVITTGDAFKGDFIKQENTRSTSMNPPDRNLLAIVRLIQKVFDYKLPAFTLRHVDHHGLHDGSIAPGVGGADFDPRPSVEEARRDKSNAEATASHRGRETRPELARRLQPIHLARRTKTARCHGASVLAPIDRKPGSLNILRGRKGLEGLVMEQTEGRLIVTERCGCMSGCG